MLITDCQGNWLEKELKTSPEDTFIRSEVTYKEGDKKSLFISFMLAILKKPF